MYLKIEINSENDAIKRSPEDEAAKLVNDVIRKIKEGRTEGHCMDTNGNSVGEWEYRRKG